MLTAGPVRALPVASRARELARPLGAGLRMRAEALWGEIALLAGDPAGMAAAEPAAPWLGSGSSAFAYSALLIERLADADRAFPAARAPADPAGAPPAMSMLACRPWSTPEP